MQSETKNQSIDPDAPEIQDKIKEAELYLDQGLFDIARQIYQDLLEHLGSMPDETADPVGHRSHKTQRAFLQAQINLVNRREAQFHGEEPPPEVEPEKVEEAPEEEDIAPFARVLERFTDGIRIARGAGIEPSRVRSLFEEAAAAEQEAKREAV